ncbi:putative glycolipid-binding domain-containing protein, partial [Actinomadura adrarensis]
LRGATDCDLGLSPLTNTMPALRLGGKGSLDILAAWVSVPDLAVTPSPQTYEFVREDGAVTVIRYTDPGFTEEIAFSGGLVLDYPSIGRRVEPEIS